MRKLAREPMRVVRRVSVVGVAWVAENTARTASREIEFGGVTLLG
jgi:hypothetical protein